MSTVSQMNTKLCCFFSYDLSNVMLSQNQTELVSFLATTPAVQITTREQFSLKLLWCSWLTMRLLNSSSSFWFSHIFLLFHLKLTLLANWPEIIKKTLAFWRYIIMSWNVQKEIKIQDQYDDTINIPSGLIQHYVVSYFKKGHLIKFFPVITVHDLAIITLYYC